MGPTHENLIIGVAGTGATLVNVNNTITGSGTIGQGDGALTLINGKNGTIEATPLPRLRFRAADHRYRQSRQQFRHVDGRRRGTLQIDDPVTNLGLIQAQADSTILITGRLEQRGKGLSGGLILLDERSTTAGTISANGAGANVDLDKAVIGGGTVESSDGGVIATTAGQSTFRECRHRQWQHS